MSATTTTESDAGHGGPPEKSQEFLHEVVVRFAGDSGDGMQLTGDRFTAESAVAGNDVATFPDYPAEIRAPAGTLAGVSSFQLHFSDHEIHTPGDAPEVLVAMNPAALKKHAGDVAPRGTIIVNTDGFTKGNLKKAGYATSPLEDHSLDGFHVHQVAITDMTTRALAAMIESGDISNKEAQRCKNMFALGMVSWMFSRDTDTTVAWLEKKFAAAPAIAEANVKVLRAGYNFGETTEVFVHRYDVKPAVLPPGRYRNITGNQALAYGLIAASVKSGLPLFYGSYPITPASDILHELAKHKNFGVKTFQAEDEIAAAGTALGAAFAGSLAVTASSGPGIALKAETIGLALSVELPMVIINVQRGGPSTGLPTKTEQSDLLQMMYGRNGESPLPVIAAQSPSDCFYAAFEAARIALTHRMPVILMSDGYLANSAEPWLLPDVDALPEIDVQFTTEPNTEGGDFLSFQHDPETLARPWAVPGTPGLAHRIGGLEKQDGTGNISYDAANHHHMTELRQAKVDIVARSIAPLEVDSVDGSRLLLLGWGSTYGPIRAATKTLRADGVAVDRLHLRHLNPFPDDLGEVLGRYEHVLVPEMNMGQLAKLLRAKYLIDIKSHNRVAGLPFRSTQITEAALALLEVQP